MSAMESQFTTAMRARLRRGWDWLTSFLPIRRTAIPSKREHPTPKPVALAAHFIRLHTRKRDVVLDPFMGGGSTLLAAKALGRRAIGIEIEKRYCKLAVERLENLK